jgi:hypothetical protein
MFTPAEYLDVIPMIVVILGQIEGWNVREELNQTVTMCVMRKINQFQFDQSYEESFAHHRILRNSNL